MPTEVRHIIFSNDEIIRAVVDYHRRNGSSLPAGSVIKMEVMANPEIRCALHIAVDGESSGAANGRQVAWVDTATLAAALILFCINQRIPLPSKALKQLEMLNGRITLVVHRTPDRTVRAA
jgi:hypothetical protein